MQIDVLTIFPDMFTGFLGESIIRRAQEKGKLKVNVHNLRDWTSDAHRSVDDRPFGGGPGMVMKPEPLFAAVEEILKRNRRRRPAAGGRRGGCRIVLFTPQGVRFSQRRAEALSGCRQLILICGRYEGVDERVRRFLVTDEISVGDYVLTGGELPAMVLIDAITRLIPGVLGDPGSLKDESFADGLLEYPHYTRPRNFRGRKVPAVLLSGDHRRIEAWRRKRSLARTRERRPDLIDGRAPAARPKEVNNRKER